MGVTDSHLSFKGITFPTSLKFPYSQLNWQRARLSSDHRAWCPACSSPDRVFHYAQPNLLRCKPALLNNWHLLHQLTSRTFVALSLVSTRFPLKPRSAKKAIRIDSSLRQSPLDFDSNALVMRRSWVRFSSWAPLISSHAEGCEKDSLARNATEPNPTINGTSLDRCTVCLPLPHNWWQQSPKTTAPIFWEWV